MQVFFKKIALYFLLLAGMALLYILVIYLRPELVDTFYGRFTTDRAYSMILGTSRSAQGIKPSIINERINLDDRPIVNHSFAVGPSSYGPNYLREIKQKINPDAARGLFILSVDPWSLATEEDNINDDSTKFYEVKENLFVGNLSSSSSNPNFDYLQNYWNSRFSPFGNGFKHLINYEGLLELHPDGWLEVDITMDPAKLEGRIKASTEEYRAKKMFLSNTRFDYLEKIVDFLQDKGTLFFVRLPVSPGMAEIEKEKFPTFDDKVLQLTKKYGIPYFNFIGDSGKYQTIDTHHLHKKESTKITHRICDSILLRMPEYAKLNTSK